MNMLIEIAPAGWSREWRAFCFLIGAPNVRFDRVSDDALSCGDVVGASSKKRRTGRKASPNELEGSVSEAVQLEPEFHPQGSEGVRIKPHVPVAHSAGLTTALLPAILE